MTLKNLVIVVIAIVIIIYVGVPIMNWFDQVSDAAAQSSQTHTEIR